MRQFRLFALINLAMCSMMSAAVSFIDRAVAFVFGLFSEASLRLAGDIGIAPRVTAGITLDRTLVQSMRHEAGIPRRSAARNI